MDDGYRDRLELRAPHGEWKGKLGYMYGSDGGTIVRSQNLSERIKHLSLSRT